MKPTIEIKYRGPLQSKQLQTMKRYLSQYAIRIKQENESVFYFESTVFPSIGDFKWGAARMSMKISKSYIYLRLKEGNAAAAKRENYTVKVLKSQAAALLYILHRLGLTHAFYRPSFRQEYQYGNLLIIIKQRCVMGDHFEISLKEESSKEKKELVNFLKKFQLRCWTQTQYKNRITRLMKVVPAIPLLDISIV